MVFPGQGPQWWAMGRDLFMTDTVFREALQECDRQIRLLSNWSLLQELQKSKEHSRIDRDFSISQPSLVALQIGPIEAWRARGISPDFVIGHSMGETAAAYASGALQMKDALTVILHQGRILKKSASRGLMVAVHLPPVVLNNSNR
jgi:hybrid polyketide synthase/nonribosomal peptide synthetase FtdB